MTVVEDIIKTYANKRRKWCVFNQTRCLGLACQLWDEEIEDCGLKRRTHIIIMGKESLKLVLNPKGGTKALSGFFWEALPQNKGGDEK